MTAHYVCFRISTTRFNIKKYIFFQIALVRPVFDGFNDILIVFEGSKDQRVDRKWLKWSFKSGATKTLGLSAFLIPRNLYCPGGRDGWMMVKRILQIKKFKKLRPITFLQNSKKERLSKKAFPPAGKRVQFRKNYRKSVISLQKIPKIVKIQKWP